MDPGSPEAKGGARKRGGAAGTRYDNSLALLTQRFVTLIQSKPGAVVDLNDAAVELEVQKRRMYDIINVLEGVGLVDKTYKNYIRWCGSEVRASPEVAGAVDNLRAELLALREEERELTQHTEAVRKLLQVAHADPEISRHIYTTTDEVQRVLEQEQCSFTIHARPGSTLFVPETAPTGSGGSGAGGAGSGDSHYNYGQASRRPRYHVYVQSDFPVRVLYFPPAGGEDETDEVALAAAHAAAEAAALASGLPGVTVKGPTSLGATRTLAPASTGDAAAADDTLTALSGPPSKRARGAGTAQRPGEGRESQPQSEGAAQPMAVALQPMTHDEEFASVMTDGEGVTDLCVDVDDMLTFT